ncbi:hypothetical protein HDU89_001568 [Geranomyces variabilis]|nr:hypothetical protein HDU89_001568 [Geranomyces variabilis]
MATAHAERGHKARNSTTRQRKLYIHPPSIPTRFQTFCFDDGERRAFGSSAARFTRRLDELPGPGYYVVAGDGGGAEKGPGFVSKSKRFPPPDASHPSPTHYTPHTTPIYSHSLTASPSAAFIPSPIHAQRSVSPPVPLWKSRFEKPTPGPGAYDAERAGDAEQRRPRYRRRMAVFKSTSRRSEVNELGWTPGRDAPAPDAYSILESRVVKEVGGAIAAFRAVPRDSAFAFCETSNPGPGTYDVRAPSPTPPSHYRPLWRPPPSQPLHHTPGPPAIPLNHLTSVPGSNVPPISNPGPGAYDVPAAAEHASQRRRPADTKGSVFASITPRFAQPDGARQRGPGFYSPVAERGRRTFRLNLGEMWAC